MHNHFPINLLLSLSHQRRTAICSVDFSSEVVKVQFVFIKSRGYGEGRPDQPRLTGSNSNIFASLFTRIYTSTNMPISGTCIKLSLTNIAPHRGSFHPLQVLYSGLLAQLCTAFRLDTAEDPLHLRHCCSYWFVCSWHLYWVCQWLCLAISQCALLKYLHSFWLFSEGGIVASCVNSGSSNVVLLNIIHRRPLLYACLCAAGIVEEVTIPVQDFYIRVESVA